MILIWNGLGIIALAALVPPIMLYGLFARKASSGWRSCWQG